MMKILILSYDFPYPIKSGGQSAQFQIIDYLKHNHSLTIISPKPEIAKEDLEHINNVWKEIEIIFVEGSEQDKSKKYPSYKLSFFDRVMNRIFFQRKITRQRFTLIPKDYRVPLYFNEFIANHLKENSYDIIQCETTPCLNTVKYIPSKIPSVFVHQEIAFIRERCLLKTFDWHDQMAFARLLQRNKQKELDYLSAFSAVVVFNEEDKKSLKDELPNLSVEISPYPVDIDKFEHIYAQKYQFDNRIIFLGGQDHYPNFEGVKWFLENVWNDVVQSNPNLKLYIIGKWRENTIQKYSYLSNVFFTGYVTDLGIYFKNSIMVVPVRIGSGIRTKILDAFAAGVPVISTSTGMYGIDYTNREDCVVADDPLAFAKSLLNLVKDNESLKVIRKNAYNIVVSNFSKTSCGKLRENTLKKVVKLHIVDQ